MFRIKNNNVYNNLKESTKFEYKDSYDVTDKIEEDICISIKTHCSPRHIPHKIIQIEDIPYTINGKKVELAVKNIIEGKNVNNVDALSNPESLDFYKDINIMIEI